MRRKFHTVDVFTDTPLAGNPLAIVLDCDGLDTARMQSIAREFNLSETVFVLEPADPVNTARLRIFTPGREMPFAGHPTVGAAVLIAELRAPEMLAVQDIGLVLEEGVGPVACTVRHVKGRAAQAHFILPQLPQKLRQPGSPEAIAAALGVPASDIGFEAHEPSVYSAGNAFNFVPIRNRDAIAGARPNIAHWQDAFGGQGATGAFLYTRDVARAGNAFHARMFAPGAGIGEDPATGSAAAAFAGVIMERERPADGDHSFVIEQGFEMGRPSLITLGLTIDGGQLAAGSIGGPVVMIAQGIIDV